MNIMNQFTNRSMNQMLNNGINTFQNMGQNAMSNIDPMTVRAASQKVAHVASKALLLAAIVAGFVIDFIVAVPIVLFLTYSEVAWNFYTVFIIVIGAIQLGCVIKLFSGGKHRQKKMNKPQTLHIINGKEVWK